MPLGVGERAPGFSLRDQHGQTVELASYAGKSLVVVFYPWAFSRVCSGELAVIGADLPAYQRDTAGLVAISCDPMFSLRAFADSAGIEFPLLSDHWPHGEVARAFGVFNEQTGAADRSTFVIDREGVIRWTVHSGLGDARDASAYAAVLDQLDAESKKII